MNYSICMKNKCQKCKKKARCFKEEDFYCEYLGKKHREVTKEKMDKS